MTPWTESGIEISESRPVDDPAAVPPLERALLDQHLQHLLDEERVALRAREDRAPHVLRHLRLAEQRRDELARTPPAKRREGERRRVLLARAPGRSVIEELRPRRADEQHLRLGERLGELLDQVEERRRRPVDVLDDEHRELLAAERADVSLPGVRQRVPDVLGVGRDDRRVPGPEADRPGDRLENALAVPSSTTDCDRRSELRQCSVGRSRCRGSLPRSWPPRRAASR